MSFFKQLSEHGLSMWGVVDLSTPQIALDSLSHLSHLTEIATNQFFYCDEKSLGSPPCSPPLSPISQLPTPVSTPPSSPEKIGLPIIDDAMINCPRIQTWIPEPPPPFKSSSSKRKRRSCTTKKKRKPSNDSDFTDSDSDCTVSDDVSDDDDDEEEGTDDEEKVVIVKKENGKGVAKKEMKKNGKSVVKKVAPKKIQLSEIQLSEEEKLIAAIENYVNEYLPVRIRFPSSAQHDESPGPQEHTGILQAFRGVRKCARGGYLWEFIISFEDPLCNVRKLNGKNFHNCFFFSLSFSIILHGLKIFIIVFFFSLSLSIILHGLKIIRQYLDG